MQKRNIILLIVAVIAVAALSSIPILTNNEVSDKAADASNIDERPLNTDVNDKTAENLKVRLENVIQIHGGFTDQRSYDEIDSGIQNLEIANYNKTKTDELRDLLSRLTIGGMPDGQESNVSNKTPVVTGPVRWDYRNGTWIPSGTPPACPSSVILELPVDMDRITGILYPGQVRGTDFKPHGGFATNNEDIPVEVRAPFDGYVKHVAHFTDQFGVHYSFFVQHECGIAYSFGHLGALPPKTQSIIDKVPIREYGDSRTTEVEPVFIEKGDVIATDKQHGVGFDFGVLDLRKENDAAQDPAFREAHADEPWWAYYSVCWLDWFPPETSQKLREFPGVDGKSGKNSDYC